MSGPTNNERALWAQNAVDTFRNEVMQGEDNETTIGDLLCNLMHLCDACGIDFDARLESGRNHYDAETNGDEFEEGQPKADSTYADI